VNGRSNADAAHTVQVNEAGNVFDCLMQVDGMQNRYTTGSDAIGLT
jgi:hypothetical protein